ncbi:hypothetical protein KM043_016318 [Ampulex compressa]|nr:hypothetical protein KM043_016318 [Ampulex compressa]
MFTVAIIQTAVNISSFEGARKADGSADANLKRASVRKDFRAVPLYVPMQRQLSVTSPRLSRTSGHWGEDGGRACRCRIASLASEIPGPCALGSCYAERGNVLRPGSSSPHRAWRGGTRVCSRLRVVHARGLGVLKPAF